MKKLFLLFILIAATNISFAQTAGASFVLGYPQGEFRENVNRMGYGLSLEGSLWSPTKERPYSIGLHFGYLVYGQISERKPWSDFPGIYLKLDRTNSMANLHINMKVAPFFGTVRPYAEALFGGNYIFTTSSVKNENGNKEVASSTNFDDFTWSYGGSVGILFKIKGKAENMEALYLDLKGQYLFGTEAQYLTEESVFVNSLGKTIFSPLKSKTDFFTFQIGVIAYLDLN